MYAARSGTWIEEWEQLSWDPVVERGFFDDLVRQTLAVNLSELMETAAVLAMVDQMEAGGEEGGGVGDLLRRRCIHVD